MVKAYASYPGCQLQMIFSALWSCSSKINRISRHYKRQIHLHFRCIPLRSASKHQQEDEAESVLQQI